jgi:hypothetical protein
VVGEVLKFFRIATGITYVTLLLSSCVFDSYLETHRPDHAVGRFVHPEAAHGGFYFVTPNEHLISVGLWVALFVAFAIAAVVEVWTRAP